MNYYETLQFTDGNGAQQEVAFQNLSAAGCLPPQYTPRSMEASEFRLALPQAPEAGGVAATIPFKSRCKVWACRQSVAGAQNSFSGGTILFQGRRTNRLKGSVSGSRVTTEIVLSDAFWDLKHITYQASWKFQNGGTLANPTFGSFTWPDVVLFQATPGVVYNPPALNQTITTWQQLQDVIRWATTFVPGNDAVQLQLAGAPEFTPSYVNFNAVRCMKCLPVLKLCLRPHPMVRSEIDYSTTPPTLHFRDVGNCNQVTLPYKSTINGMVHIASTPESLEELIPDRVALYYKVNGQINGQPAVSYAQDIYPVGKGPSLFSEDFSIDITGASLSQVSYVFASTPFNSLDLNFWRTKVPSLKEVAQGGQIPNDGGTGALAMVDQTVNGGLANHPKGVQVVDENGNAVNLGTYLYYTDMDVFGWMQVSNGIPAVVVATTASAFFSYTKSTGFGGVTVSDKATEHQHSARIKLTNAPSGTYQVIQTLSTGEAIPVGLAKNIYTELQTLQWKLRHEVMQVAATAGAVPTLVKPGRDVVNLQGGDAAWLNMQAVPEGVTITFQRTGQGLLMARMTIECGPVDSLEPAYRISLFNLFANRNLRRIDTSQRVTGAVASSSTDLTAQSARENSVPGQPVDSVTNIVGLDGGGNIAGWATFNAAAIAFGETLN